MGLFDKLDKEEKDEVQLRAPDTDTAETNLEEEVEERLMDEEDSSGTSSGSTGSSSGSGSMLPGVDTGSSSRNIEIEDVHEQNEKIIELLKEIKNSGRGTI